MKNIRALILAAGRGSRMKEATELQPKCLTRLAGKTLLEWQYLALRVAGIENITVVCGYKHELLESPLYKCALNPNWDSTNMVKTMFCADKSDLDTIVSYSDIVYSPSHINALVQAKGDIVITADLLWYDLWALRFADPLNDAETFKVRDGHLMEIGKKTLDMDDIQAQYMGLLKFSCAGWEKAYAILNDLPVEKQNTLDMTSLLNLLIAEGTEINVVFIKGKWCEVDSQADLACYNKMLSHARWVHDWR